jgi:hypothetical protein
MIALRTNNRKSRKTRLALEVLDLRIAPTTIPAAAALAAEMRVETRQVQKWETSLASAVPGSQHEKTLMHRIAGEERLMGRQAVRIANMESRAAARAHVAVVVPASNFVSPSIQPSSATTNFSVASPINTTAATTSSSSTTTTPISDDTATGSQTGQGSPTTTDTNSQSTLPANVSVTLDAIYNAFTQDPSSFPANIASLDGASMVVIQGSNVGIQVHDGNPADFSALLTTLQNDGMQVTISSAQDGTIVGLLPIAQLPTVASLTQAPSITPELNPVLQ